MMGEGLMITQSSSNITNTNANSSSSPKKTKKKKRGGTKKKMTTEQTLACKSVSEWVFLEQSASAAAAASSCVSVDGDDFVGGAHKSLGIGCVDNKPVFELHSHSKCSDGFLSPSKLVERAHGNGVSEFSPFRNLNEWNTPYLSLSCICNANIAMS